jgi:DNA-directed RNA polymerase specialized sigma24 family protein
MPSTIPLPRSAVVPLSDVALPGPATGRANLICLVRRIATEDHVAFGELYDALSAPLLRELRSSTSDVVDASAIASGTFVEVWSMARFHATPDMDVYAWVSDIAARRTADRRPLAAARSHAEATTHGPDAPGRPPWLAAAADSHDRHTNLALADLLARPTRVAA